MLSCEYQIDKLYLFTLRDYQKPQLDLLISWQLCKQKSKFVSINLSWTGCLIIALMNNNFRFMDSMGEFV